MTDYWIKWYHEILDDPKMALLPDRLWRRFSEVCLLAGKLYNDKSGIIPETRQLAWLLRMNAKELQTDLGQLEELGLINSVPTGWLIINFSKRQSSAEPAAGRTRRDRNTGLHRSEAQSCARRRHSVRSGHTCAKEARRRRVRKRRLQTNWG